MASIEKSCDQACQNVSACALLAGSQLSFRSSSIKCCNNSLISSLSATAAEALTSPDFMPQARSPEDRSDHESI